jgi:hypothetical protein
MRSQTYLEIDRSDHLRPEAETDDGVPARPVEEGADEQVRDLGGLEGVRGVKASVQLVENDPENGNAHDLAEDEGLPTLDGGGTDERGRHQQKCEERPKQEPARTVDLGLLLAGLEDVAIGDELGLDLCDDAGGDEDEPVSRTESHVSKARHGQHLERVRAHWKMVNSRS